MKILVAGPLQCGKSSYVQFFDENAINIDSRSRTGVKTTVAMDFGVIKSYDCDVFLFGTPGLLRFKIIRSILAEGSDGIIFIFDAANPITDEKGISILNEIRKYTELNTPIVFLANKSDLPEARSPEIIRAQNYIPKKFNIIPTSIKTGINVSKSLDILIKDVCDKWKDAIALLAKYESNVPGLANALEKNPRHIKNYLNMMEFRGIITYDRIRMTYFVKERLKERVKNLIKS